MNRTTSPWLAALTSVFILVLVAACGGSAAGSASPTTGQPSVAAPSVASPSEAASEGAPSAGSSLALPSFALPNDDKGLEALLPDEMCGGKATKLSFGGSRFAGVADDEFTATLAALGKKPEDVSFAISAGPLASGGVCPTSAGVFRIKGVDPGRLHDVYLAEVAKEGQSQEQRNVGGKDVSIGTSTDNDTKTYAYFNGDAIFFVTAKNDDDAAAVLKVMP